MTEFSSETFTVDFEPIGRRASFASGTSVFEAAREAGIEIVSLCGGIGSCDSCRVQVVSGQVSKTTIEEEALFSIDELASGWRLACQVRPLDDVKVTIPSESLSAPQRLLIEGEYFDIPFDPPLKIVNMEVEPAGIHDLRSDVQRLRDALAGQDISAASIELSLVRELPALLRAYDWRLRALIGRDGQLPALLPPKATPLGLALDIGTTSIAAYLVELSYGEIIGKCGEMNPQIAYGEDVVSRIQYCNEFAGGSARLQSLVVDTVNQMAAQLCAEAGFAANQIVDVVVVGNTAMHHLFAGLPVKQLGEAPYVPVTNESLSFRTSDVGLAAAPGARVMAPPIIAGYVGADHAAMLLAAGIWQASDTVIAIDVGTNTEVSLRHGERILCCSCASGPAFEGAHVSSGMRAAPGAVERVQLVDGPLRVKTVGDIPAVGICGSGIVDAVAVMIQDGAVNQRGAIQKSHPRVFSGNGSARFILVSGDESGTGRDISVTGKDVSEIQLAKSAIRTGIEILLAEAGIEAGTVDRFIIAGAFGNYINVSSAIRLGMFPDLPLERFHQVGNAAGMGAYQLLMSAKSRELVEQITRKIEYVELTTHPDFSDQFINRLSF